MSRSSQLYDLQKIDSQLDNYQRRISEINTILSDNSEIKLAEELLKIAESGVINFDRDLQEAKRKVQNQRLKIKQTDTKLYGGKIRNPKELQDLQDESEALKRYLEILEDRQLELMLEVDSQKEIMDKKSESLRQITEKINVYHKDLTQELTNTQKNINKLSIKRLATIQTISPDDQNMYQNLRKKRLGVAVSMVSDGACNACGATLTASLHQSARSANQITYCETCGRILFAN